MKWNEEVPRPILLMADYMNKKHYTYFNCPFESANYVIYNALLKYGYMPKVVIIRFVIVGEDTWAKANIEIEERNNIKVYKIPISDEVDKCEKAPLSPISKAIFAEVSPQFGTGTSETYIFKEKMHLRISLALGPR